MTSLYSTRYIIIGYISWDTNEHLAWCVSSENAGKPGAALSLVFVIM